MKISVLLTFLLSIFMSLSIHAEREGQDRGGGAGFQLGDKYITLAEAGFRVTPDPVGHEIQPETLVAIEDLKNMVPFWLKDQITLNRFIGDKQTISFLDIEDPNKLEYFLDEYRNFIKKQDPSFNTPNLRIIAFTIEKRTYLIANRFMALNGKRGSAMAKALLLYHEMNVRRGTAVPAIVKFDGLLLDYLDARDANALETFNFWNFYKAAQEASIINSGFAYNLMLAHLFRNQPIPEELKYVIDGDKIGHVLSLQMRRYHPRFSKDLSEVSITLYNPRITRTDLLGTKQELNQSPVGLSRNENRYIRKGYYQVDQERWLPSTKEEILKRLSEKIRFTNNTDAINDLYNAIDTKCGGIDDDQRFTHLMPMSHGEYIFMSVGCQIHPRKFPGGFSQFISRSSFVGLRTGLTNGIICTNRRNVTSDVRIEKRFTCKSN